MKRRGLRRLAVVALSLVVAGAGDLAAQEDSVRVRAGLRYRAGDLKEFLLGEGYREVWAVSIDVPVLDPDTFAGGLTVLEEGGGRQTQSLRFGADDGREFVFRSVDKDQSGGLHADLRGTLVDRVVQDQISAKHPGAALVAAPLLEAAGVLHAVPTIAVMDDSPVLGEYREEFAGMLGTIEARPTETEGVGRFGAYERLIGTDRLLERLEESPEDRADAPAFLAARLMDLLLGDWDRHQDQWRWAQTERGGRRVWLPIPRDRDNAFFSTGGVVGLAGGMVRPFVISYDERYPELYGLIYNAAALDRRILPELPLAAWDSVAVDLRDRLTDGVIEDALRHLPPSYRPLSAAELGRKLRARRDSLPAVARDFYAQVLREAEVYATDEADTVTVERRPDGSLGVRIRGGEQGLYFDRVFHPSETREVRIHLQGGADHATVVGDGPGGITLRLLGGGGADHLEDAAAPGAGRTILYDDRENANVLVPGPETVVDTRYFAPPASDTLTVNNQPPPRDWGASRAYLAPTVGWRSQIGPVLVAGPEWIRYGFRRFPYARRAILKLQAAPLQGRFGVAAELHRVRTGATGETRLRASATQLLRTRFHGYGNESPEGEHPGERLVWATEYAGAAELIEVLGERGRASVGPVAMHVDPDPRPGSPAETLRPPGSRAFTLAGVAGSLAFDGRDSPSYPTRGTHVAATAEWYPLARGDAPEPFVRTGITASAYLPVPFPLETVLAVRGGGEAVRGTPPFQLAPAIGGGSSLRGYRSGRFVGDASLFGNAELRTALGRVNLLVARGDFGAIALADAGRVYLTGEDSDRWHSAYGGGLWFGPVDRKYTAHLLLVQGERLQLTAGLGLPF